MMCLSWPFLICLLLSILFDHNTLLHRLQSVCSISGTVLSWLESYLTGWTQTVTVNDRITCRCFLRCPTGLSSWSYPLHSLLCTSLLFVWNSFCLQPVFCWWHTTTSLLSSWSGACHCPDHADTHLWCENLDDTKQTETEWWQDRAVLTQSNRTTFSNSLS